MLQELFKDLVAWWKEVLGSAVSTVKVSSRLATSPAIVVTSQYGWSANMERIMRAQALGGDSQEKAYMKGMKTLEVNPRHPLVEQLRVKVGTSFSTCSDACGELQMCGWVLDPAEFGSSAVLLVMLLTCITTPAPRQFWRLLCRHGHRSTI